MKISSLRPVIAAAALIALPSGAAAQDRGVIPPYREAGLSGADAVRDDLMTWYVTYRQAWAAQDGAALARLHTRDAEWINAFARIIQDADTLQRFLDERMFPAFPPETSRNEADAMALVSLRRLGDDAAVMHVYTDSMRGVPQSASPRRVHIHHVLTRTGQGWRAAHTVIMDARR